MSFLDVVRNAARIDRYLLYDLRAFRWKLVQLLHRQPSLVFLFSRFDPFFSSTDLETFHRSIYRNRKTDAIYDGSPRFTTSVGHKRFRQEKERDGEKSGIDRHVCTKICRSCRGNRKLKSLLLTSKGLTKGRARPLNFALLDGE